MRGLLIRAAGAAAALLVSAGAAHANLVQNGSFEAPVVEHEANWDIFESIPGWSLMRGPAIELHRGYHDWKCADGDQYVELDSDTAGPADPLYGEGASSAIFQDIETIAGETYILSLAFSPRPGVTDNALEVKWDGAVVDTVNANGSLLNDTDWQTLTYEVVATGSMTRLELGDVGTSNSYGTLVDDVSVLVVPEPATIGLLGLGIMAWVRRRR